MKAEHKYLIAQWGAKKKRVTVGFILTLNASKSSSSCEPKQRSKEKMESKMTEAENF